MAFLIKYIALVVAFLSAAKLVESVELKLVSDADAVQAYADLVKQDMCESFDPLNDEHMAAIGDDVDTLKHLLIIYHMGDEIEICEPKEGDRILLTGTAVMVGLGAGMLMNGQNVNAVSSWVSSWWG